MRWQRSLLFTASLFLLPAATSAQSVPPAEKQPWQWTVEERIEERCDRKAARERVDRARLDGTAPTRVRDGRLIWSPLADEISGKRTPHLFLPTELFESVVRNGFILEGWREAYEAGIARSGLPATFWEDLQVIATPLIADLRQRWAIGQMEDKFAARRMYAELEPQLCASRAEALARARATFGTALDVFMYRHVAPTKSISTTEVENPASLRAREQGCR
jgi:hypothetical protein